MSLDESIMDKIDDVVCEWINDEKMFSAFEVSIESKKRGANERHRNMKHYVHQSIAENADGAYSRTLLDVGAPVQAWVYHPLNANPFLYRPLKRGNAPQSAAVTPTVPPLAASTGTTAIPATSAANYQIRNPKPISVDDSGGTPDGVFGSDVDGFLKIPADLISSINIVAGAAVQLFHDFDGQKMTVAAEGAIAVGDHENTKAQADGSLMLSADELEKADLDWMQSYAVNCVDEKIEVTKN